MKYYYDITDGYDYRECYYRGEPVPYYNAQTIRRFRVYKATPAIEKAALKDGSGLWPVHDPFAPIDQMNQCVECKDLEEAYDYIMMAENHSIFEFLMDI